MNDQNTTTIHGRITGLYGDVLQGWALDPAKPDLRLVIEIYIDGSSVAFVRANEFHPDASGGDQFNGFAVQLRESWLTRSKMISARVANQEEWLAGTVQLPAPLPAEPAPAASQVWHTGGLRVSGWAFDAHEPNRAVTITIREGTDVVATALADRLHHALAYKASREHGFELDLPWYLADGKVHTLHVQTDLGEPLSGSPVKFCCWPEGLEAMLRSNQAAFSDEAKLTLLTEVARHQELILPKSAGFNHYPQWFEVFQKPEPLSAASKQNCGVLIITDGDAQLEDRSRLSVNQQRHPAKAIEVAAVTNLLPGLKRLIDQGCETIIPVSAGDRLASHALDVLEPLLDAGAAWAYADCDCDGPAGERSAPWLKPVWDLDLFIGADLFSDGAIFSTELVERAIDIAIGGSALELVSWQRLLASVALITEREALKVVHLPKVIYHRHAIRPRTPADAPHCELREAAMGWLVNSLKKGATVERIPDFPGMLRARWPLPEQLPKVSIMIPTRDQVKLLRTCVEGVLKQTDYPNLEVIIIDNESSEPETLTYLAELKTRGVVILPHPFPFNYPAVNNRAAEIATGEFVCLLNNDIEILGGDWLKELVSQVMRPDVDVAGAKLLWANGMVQHGGVIIGINGLAAHSGNCLSAGDGGYLGLNQLTHRTSSVTGACMLMATSLYLEHCGMEEKTFPIAFNDVDLCLRIQASGRKLIWDAFATLIHAESASRGKDISTDRRARAKREQDNFIARWTCEGAVDPHYHPALSTDYLTGPYMGLKLGQLNLEIRHLQNWRAVVKSVS
ncbi:glycosyltransferase [Pseudomonas sp. CFBP 8770]|uniref:glycosyltransferase family 2 protein n=1 Tax=unclassified Pseudomonas TaxID=196821 RepID=UPI00177BBF37|nr:MULTISPECIES: glycosyltransferase [unclassified Pseudomonas]MBD8472759.1 glycosyltransferase [Pseudomonas sp. CFBP 8773]MBD8646139.1 glycosyltransferase [Pseudomonas sp. CFBP 8770]